MGNTCHAMGDTTTKVSADDHRLREEDIKRMVDNCRPYSAYDIIKKKYNLAKMEIEIPQED